MDGEVRKFFGGVLKMFRHRPGWIFRPGAHRGERTCVFVNDE